MSYKALNASIIELVGGKENIASVTHCVTRLRFKLNDRQKAQTDRIKALDGVIDVIVNDVAYQVVIGTQVGEVYEELVSMLGMGEDVASVKADRPKTLRGWITSALSAIAETINPFLEVLMAAGVISAILSLLGVAGILPADSSTYLVLDALKSGVFTYLPVLIASGFAKRRGVSPYLAMALSFALVSGSINGVEGLELFGLPLQTVAYTNTFIPALLGTWVLCVVVERLNRIIPRNVQFFVNPALSLLISLPITLFFFGPVGNVISDGLNAIFMFLMNNVGNWLATTFYGIAHPFLMVTGAGAFTVPITLNFLGTLGYDPALLPAGLIADMGIFGALLGYFLRALALRRKTGRDSEKEIDLFGTTAFSAFMGITEPGLYGVFLKYRRPFIAVAIGAGIGSLIAGLTGVKTYGYVWGIMSLPTYVAGGIGNLMWVIVSVLTSFTISAVAAYLMGYEGASDSARVAGNSPEEGDSSSSPLRALSIGKVVDGEAVALSEVSDAAFSSGALGKGAAIVPSEGVLDVTAPLSGEVTVVFPTGHAYGIKSDQGVEVLIHIGIDTVNLEGKGFSPAVTQGQHVEAGELLGKFNADVIRQEGFDPTAIVVVSNTNDFLDVVPAPASSASLLSVVTGK